jgi:hypothetical protein
VDRCDGLVLTSVQGYVGPDHLMSLLCLRVLHRYVPAQGWMESVMENDASDMPIDVFPFARAQLNCSGDDEHDISAVATDMPIQGQRTVGFIVMLSGVQG